MDIPSYYTLQQCDQVTVQNMSMPYMKSLYSCLNRMIGEGYTDSFEKASDSRFKSGKTGKYYPASEIRVVNFFRFEGNSDPTDNVTMYILETVDGIKGTMVGSYDPFLLADVRKSPVFA